MSTLGTTRVTQSTTESTPLDSTSSSSGKATSSQSSARKTTTRATVSFTTTSSSTSPVTTPTKTTKITIPSAIEPDESKWRFAVYIGAPVAYVIVLTGVSVVVFVIVKMNTKNNVQPEDIPLS